MRNIIFILLPFIALISHSSSIDEQTLRDGLALTLQEKEEKSISFSGTAGKEYRFQIDQQTALFVVTVIDD